MTRVVVHADDVGMCHGTNTAFVELSHAGAITAGSIMVPCPWFSEVADLAASDPHLDAGVHLTLNSEHRHYRWGPVSRPSAASGLVDVQGFLWGDVASLRRNAQPEAVEEEWRAQIDKAIAAGVDVTHLDTHMGSALAPEWCHRYLQVGVDYGIPVLVPRTVASYGPNKHLRGASEDEFAAFVDAAAHAGMPIFDTVLETDFARGADQPHQYESMLSNLTADLVYCAYHPCTPGPGEIEEIDPGRSHVRTDEFELFRTSKWLSWLDAQPFELIAMRDLSIDRGPKPAAQGAKP